MLTDQDKEELRSFGRLGSEALAELANTTLKVNLLETALTSSAAEIETLRADRAALVEQAAHYSREAERMCERIEKALRELNVADPSPSVLFPAVRRATEALRGQ
jgi:chromosome segregation ATPase